MTLVFSLYTEGKNYQILTITQFFWGLRVDVLGSDFNHIGISSFEG